jgi:mRNA interferase MazF
VKRGEIWTVAGGPAYAGKPRPAVIVQDDRFDANDSIIVCPLTTDLTPAPFFRLPVQPTPESGLRAPCRLMVDKLTAVPRKRLGRLVGSLGAEDVRVCPKRKGHRRKGHARSPGSVEPPPPARNMVQLAKFRLTTLWYKVDY